MNRLPRRSLLDAGAVPVTEVARIAMREGFRPREAYGAHRWFARRMACTARALLVAAATPEGADFWEAYHGGADLAGITVLDPFVGGGTMALEAARLGAHAYGADVEPVAAAVSSFQGRLRDLPDLGPILATLASTVGAEMALYHRTADADGVEGVMLHAFHVQRVTCAGCGTGFHAHPTFRLAWDDAGGRQWVACRSCSAVALAGHGDGPVACGCGALTHPADGHAKGGKATCPGCGHSEPLIAIGRRTRRPPEFDLFADETLPAGPECKVPMAGRTIRTATATDRTALARAAARLAAEVSVDPGFVPDCRVPLQGRSDGRLPAYGYTTYAQLLNPRQALHAGLLARALRGIDGAVGEALAVAFSDHMATNNAMCAYAGGWRRLTPLFSIRAYRHIARPVELNPWLAHNGRGTFPNAVRAVARAARGARSLEEPTAAGGMRTLPQRSRGTWDVRVADARNLGHVPGGMVDIVLTDPPYFDYIAYSELGHFYVPWMAATGLVAREHLDGFPAGQVAKHAARGDRAAAFASAMADCLSEVAGRCAPGARVAFTNQNLGGDGWEALATALAGAGVIPFLAFPMYGDGGPNLHKHPNSISWDSVVVCRVSGPAAPPDLAAHRGAGACEALRWRDRIAAEGLSFHAGDIANATHAAAMVAAFAQPPRRSRAARPHAVRAGTGAGARAAAPP